MNIKVGSTWKHSSGTQYEVIAIANAESTRPQAYPLTVVYRNIETGSVWSRKASEWHQSMTEARRLNNGNQSYET